MGYIYYISNNQNDKIYIGKTTSSLNSRMAQHIYEATHKECKGYNFLIHKAMRKYGIENFSISILEEVENNLLESREQYWIQQKNTCVLDPDGYGYNLTFGGEGSIKINYKEIYELWDEGNGSVKIQQMTNHSSTTIKNILKNYNLYDKEIDFARNHGVMVYQYSENGELLNSFPSISYAARQVNIDPSMISKCCNKVKKSAAGYFWSYSNSENFTPTKLKRNTPKKINQYDLNHNFIQQFNSIRAAGNSLNKKNTSYIKQCCEGKRESMYGYLWEYDNFVDKMAQERSMING